MITLIQKFKFHCLTGKAPVSIEDIFRVWHALTSKRPVSNTNWLTPKSHTLLYNFLLASIGCVYFRSYKWRRGGGFHRAHTHHHVDMYTHVGSALARLIG